MFDITGPKVLWPTVLFAVLSPGFLLSIPKGAPRLQQAGTHAAALAIVYWAISTFITKVSLTTADLFVPAVLFIALTPGVLLTLPSDGGVMAIAVHALVFAIVFAFLRGQFPQYY